MEIATWQEIRNKDILALERQVVRVHHLEILPEAAVTIGLDLGKSVFRFTTSCRRGI